MAGQSDEQIYDETKRDTRTRRNLRRAMGSGYIAAVGCCGMVLMAFSLSLEETAVNCGTTSVEVGTVFIAMAAGTGVGVLISSVLYRNVQGNAVPSMGLLFLAGILFSMPFVSSVLLLHLAYFLWGVLFNTITTGCQIMTRKVHGKEAGVWMAANMVALGLSSVLVTLLFYVNDSLSQRYAILSAWCCVSAFYLGIVLPVPEKTNGLDEEALLRAGRSNVAAAMEPAESGTCMDKCSRFIKTYSVELHMCIMLVLLVGGQTASTAYLSTFVERTNAIADSQETLLVVNMWVAAAVGLVGGLWDQHRCTVRSLYHHLTMALLCGGVAGASLLTFQDSALVVWVCVALLGLSYGPTVGYCYELYNRISVPSETGVAIVTFGVNFGSPTIPYAVSLVLDSTTSATWFLAIIMLSRLLPFLLLMSLRRIAESKRRCIGDSAPSGCALFSAPQCHVDETARLLQ